MLNQIMAYSTGPTTAITNAIILLLTSQSRADSHVCVLNFLTCGVGQEVLVLDLLSNVGDEIDLATCCS